MLARHVGSLVHERPEHSRDAPTGVRGPLEAGSSASLQDPDDPLERLGVPRLARERPQAGDRPQRDLPEREQATVVEDRRLDTVPPGAEG